ncbi:family 2A encapsulin nanocompartment cargo protein cysteine desulfurase [Candidatus Methylomicrobium oryzae]|uniref:family 2A encapsulin nanocompartment cargo protein cysteine desulfurase n=1 Tax=Candidatus Methylomicrobium oryzae TaxID=2802053 RepID=UPI001F31F333|nr:family 2A encapsulin nanocompartment cargo protein cysteine desulfurase [Methylomicrobium sp. RS1]
MTTRSDLERFTNAPPLPDIEQLSRWANEFFTELPSGESPHFVQPAVSHSVTEAITDISPSSGHAKVPLSFSVPHESGLHELAAPSRTEEPTASGTPYYFQHYANAEGLDAVPQASATHGLSGLIGDASSYGVRPESFGLPDNGELKTLAMPKTGLFGISSGSSFYFLEEAVGTGRDAAVQSLGSAHPPFDVQAVRRDFPILNEKVNGRPLVWLDNAATTQKPQIVIDRLSQFYRHENSNIHRAAHELAARSTDAYENARQIVARFINANSADEVVFVRGSTEAINLVAQSWGRANVGPGDEIIVSWLEHHANIVPWQQLCAEKGAVLRVIPVDETGQILLSEYRKLLNDKTKLVAFTQVSNALGTITPAQEIIELAHRVGAKVLLDGAQSISHIKVDVQALDCDWFVFSGHKIYGPTGIGILYGKPEVLEAMPPWQGGGNMIEDVTFEKTVYQPAPARFEAGTGNIADAVGLGAALEYVQKIGIDNIARYEHELLAYATELLSRIPGLRLIGTAREKTSVLSFVLKGLSTADIGTALNKEGIAVRSGHHCAQPILRRFGLESTVRPSLAFYNTYAEIDWLVTVVRKIQCGKIS